MVPSQATTQHASATVDHVSEEMLAAVLANRRRFLKYQQQKDGELMASSDPQLDPVQIVEDVVDMLIDDMLHEHALELFDMCDKLGEQLFESEFKDPQPQAAEEGADLAGVMGAELTQGLTQATATAQESATDVKEVLHIHMLAGLWQVGACERAGGLPFVGAAASTADR
eukprot:CAMPEP_0202910890 /NCGR_PEP_ID=MMETSP1392-20130828/53341_1 /ASSEMBLY_ACC=CAM_ASM_000868 /TAXON_ID=225041 /ORGANISM="Chlamydomonas chlamydogama, Strain SAG 11-48b" /LENGTH=169 /DNA_ID=CAMNT_0049601167 /DNA_START=156 /DNA_END=666 /DNA_ORIENTATION=-